MVQAGERNAAEILRKSDAEIIRQARARGGANNPTAGLLAALQR